MGLTTGDLTSSRTAAEQLTPATLAEARRLLGTQLARTRKAAGVTQSRLAAEVRWSRSTVANVETARQVASREFWTACDVALGAGGLLMAEWARTAALARRLNDQTAVNLIRRQWAESPGVCVCRELKRLFEAPDASLFLGVSPVVSVRVNEVVHG
ncbi:helix-turn-helix domain-containing protein [Micromonospora sp. NPDC048935]|uniref:helix-turn-helix domain-containing protein n=1 Tax=Micromonospora sp. NPDC048935 TaxID=3364262 RepID=UPI0037134773